MYPRIFNPPKDRKKSFFIFGPRGTGKSTWIKNALKPDVFIDLLDDEIYTRLLGSSKRLVEYITIDNPRCVVIDEIQKIPALTDEVHRLIENKRWTFVLTGSSARKLKKHNANLLAGRALTKTFHPLTAKELGRDFNLKESLLWGHLPAVYSEEDKEAYLKSYVATYLREEVLQEGIVRNLHTFSRFLEAASFSQASVLNVSKVAKDLGKDPKVIEEYFQILEDLLIAVRLPVFKARPKRKTITKNKFYFFDAGVYNAIRPSGPLEDVHQMSGVALETLVFQELRALNDYLSWGYQLYYWHTQDHKEVDFVLYGKRGFVAIEVTLSNRYSTDNFKSLLMFKSDYPQAKLFYLYMADQPMRYEGIDIVPVKDFLQNIEKYV